MDSDLDLDELPPPNQDDVRAPLFALGTSSPRGRSASPVQRVPKKRVARWMGDDDDDDLGAIDNLFQDLDDLPDRLPPSVEGRPNKKSRLSDASGIADDNRWEGDDLGVDPEAEGKKKRAPKPKLDENRLLGPNGLPKLKETAKTFKFSKKGNETEDLKRLMTMYQLWAHQMFPAMNFNDTVNRVENLCKKRTLASALTNWRREAEGRAPLPDANAPKSPSPEPEAEARQQASRAPSESFDNDLDAALASTQPASPPSFPQPSPQPPAQEASDEDPGFDDADLDFDEEEAMMSMEDQPARPAPVIPAQRDDFDADEAAMLELEMEEFDAPAPNKPPSTAPKASATAGPSQAQTSVAQDEFDEIDFADEEEMLRELAQAEVTAQQVQEKGKQKSAQQDFDDFADEEELLREMDAEEIEQMAVIEDVMRDADKMDAELRAKGLIAANPDAAQPVTEEDLYA